MTIKDTRMILGFIIAITSFIACKKNESVAPQLSVSPTTISFPAEGDTLDISVDCNAQWSIANPASTWLQLSKTTGNSGSEIIQLVSTANETGASRSAILVVNSTNGQARRVKVSQSPTIYPSYNTSPKAPDATGMGSTAVQLATKFKLGWNIGNTLEATGGETSWGNPQITESYVKFVKQSGFTAIRLPCAWDLHVDNKVTAHIDQNWLNRVKEVVGYCINNDMYVMLNIHWDGGWLEQNFTALKKDSVNAKQKALWEQIATTMRDFDEHLMFASANEPYTNNAEQTNVLLSYHQTFVNAVRSTGGKNAYRCLILQGSSDWISTSDFPKDPTPNRLMFEEHNYTPSLFTFFFEDQSWGKMIYYWGAGHHSTIEPERNATFGEENEHKKYFDKLKASFVDKGIPVLMGEYGAYRRDGSAHVPKDLATHNASVDHWITFVTKEALARGIKPFWWDTGGALDRQNNTVKDQRTIDALIAGGK